MLAAAKKKKSLFQHRSPHLHQQPSLLSQRLQLHLPPQHQLPPLVLPLTLPRMLLPMHRKLPTLPRMLRKMHTRMQARLKTLPKMLPKLLTLHTSNLVRTRTRPLLAGEIVPLKIPKKTPRSSGAFFFWGHIALTPIR
ncbi:MAG: hypothetical protein H7234_00500 [Herminiimonas sp.]|nr:hypothetical protein [Herminiimonas sp.]